jgi:hypothetical protein
MGYYSRALQTMAEIMGKKEDVSKFARQHVDILKGLEHHWSPQLECYCDIFVSEGGMRFFVSVYSPCS